MSIWRSAEGSLAPPGASWCEEDHAWNFVLYSKNASRVILYLYDHKNFREAVYSYEYHPNLNKSGPIWHCRIPLSKCRQAKYYGYQVYGPQPDAKPGWHAFDPQKLILDPYTKAVFFPPEFSRQAACGTKSNFGQAPLGVLIKEEDYDWENTVLPRHDSDLVIYEMHVKGFTRHPSSKVSTDKRGTYAGLIEKIPHLIDLGITAVELMPVFQFDPQEGNYWGYMPLNFFSPHNQYARTSEGAKVQNEFRNLVKELHRAEIEVFLDVVYNHTAEGDHKQPLYSFKGLDNRHYYLHSGRDWAPYANFSGCGNTLNANNVGVRKLIVDSLRYWREEMRIDGFRFDLASIFARGTDGAINPLQSPIFAQIRTDAGLAEVRLIAEPWDAAGTHQLGREFPGWLWMQWNGLYRDALQKFVSGEKGVIAEVMTRLYGSSDLFPDDLMHSCRPWQSINYVTCHDGSSLYDLVSFEEKYNWANGENNQDGCWEYKWNSGWEGDEDVPADVFRLRKQRVKNIFCLLLLSNGTPMFRMGDEFLQTQRGNNNAYNQDNETTWLDWDRLERFQDIYRFVKLMIAFRKKHPSISRSHFWKDDILWLGIQGSHDLSPDSRELAYYLRGKSQADQDLYVMINMGPTSIDFKIQRNPEHREHWLKAIDTSRPEGKDILPEGKYSSIKEQFVEVAPQSVVVLVG